MLLFPSLIFGLSLLFWFIKPEFVQYIFLGNLWALSYPHTFSTFTRSYFVSSTNKKKAFFIISLLLALNITIVLYFDFVALINLYFYTQFFHYVRQNFGISKLQSKQWSQIDSFLFHLYHLSILCLFFKGTKSFLGFKIYTPELSSTAFYFSLFVGVCCAIYFVLNFKSKSGLLYIYFGLSAVMVINSQSFILGWLGLHLFHNTQYLKMNWKLNPRWPFWLHYIVLVFLVLIIYLPLKYLDSYFSQFVSISFCFILSVNFSHYVFDSFLWKRKFRESFP